MKYIYINHTAFTQTCLLATKNQETVGVRTFAPGAIFELDYPGLNMYVPHILACSEMDVEHKEPVVISVEPISVVEPAPVVELPEVVIPPVEEPIVEPVVEIVPEVVPAVESAPVVEEVPPVVEETATPVLSAKPAKAKAKPAKKTKK